MKVKQKTIYIPFLRWIQEATCVPQARGPPKDPRMYCHLTQLPLERAPASCCKTADWAIEYTQAPAHTMEISPRSPEGILDMMGPSTLDGGYSPSQVISSAMAREVGKGEALIGCAVCVEMAARGIGANAADTATITARRRKVNLAIL
eukprot:60792_1